MASNTVVLATAGYDQTIRFWEAPTAVCCRSLQYPDSQVNRLAITHDKQLLAVAGNPHIRLFEVAGKTPTPVASLESHRTNVTAVGFQRDTRFLYSGSEDGTVKIWDLRAAQQANQVQREFKASSAVYGAQLSPNQVEVVAGDQAGRVYLWDLRGGSGTTAVAEAQIDPEEAVRAMSLTSDGRHLAVASNRGKVVVFALCCGEGAAATSSVELRREKAWQAHGTYVLQAAYSPDNALLATASADHTVRLWATGAQQQQQQTPAQQGAGETGGKTQEEGYQPVKTLSGHQRWVWDCVWSSDTNYLVTGSSDHVARLWDVTSGETIRHYQNGHHKAISCVALNDAAA